MANSPAPALGLRDGDADELDRLLRSTSTPAGLARRARIVSLAAAGMANSRISEVVGTSVPTVLKWRSRYLHDGLDGLLDAERSGRPRHLDHADVVAATLKSPPKKYGVTHWSSRLLAGHLGIGNATVARAWREYGVQPWRSGDVQVLHRSGAGRQSHRCRRPVSGTAAERNRVVRGREEPDPSP